MTDRVYPVPAGDDDPRFSIGLMIDVIAVLVKHGYPPIRTGRDLVELQQVLFRFLYGTSNAGGEGR